MNFLFISIMGCKQSTPQDFSPANVPDVEMLSFDSEKMQTGLSYLLSLLSYIHPGELIEVEEMFTNDDFRCPEVFEGVSNTNAWNQHCDNIYGVRFAGRSQSLYAVDQLVDDVLYTSYVTYISSFTIDSTDTTLMMNGYGDLQIFEDNLFMEMVGTYAYSGPDLAWTIPQQSISLQINADDDVFEINGGVSQSDSLPEGISSVRLSKLSIHSDTVDGRVIFQDIRGNTAQIELAGDIQDCTNSDEQICWDFLPITEREW